MSDPTASSWPFDRLDLDGYLSRIGVPARPPSREALDELHERHVRTFMFDNVDVLLEQHPGVSLDAVQGKFLDRHRGGYCFEHATLLAAALERLGYRVVRRLARVGDPSADPPPARGRSHMVVEVELDGARLLCDPGFGYSIVRPVPLVDGYEDEQTGTRYRVTRADHPTTWWLHRSRGGRWEPMHSTDEALALPADVQMGHHYTSTFPGSHFRNELIVARHLPDRHVTLTATNVTIRRPGTETEHRPLASEELPAWLDTLAAALTAEETARLQDVVAQFTEAGTNR